MASIICIVTICVLSCMSTSVLVGQWRCVFFSIPMCCLFGVSGANVLSFVLSNVPAYLWALVIVRFFFSQRWDRVHGIVIRTGDTHGCNTTKATHRALKRKLMLVKISVITIIITNTTNFGGVGGIYF